MGVADWSTTPSLNTSINGVDIGENCPRANMNDMGRNIMAAVKVDRNWTRAVTPLSIDEFYNAENGAAADRMALEAALAAGTEVRFRGTLTLDKGIVLPSRARIVGEGCTSNNDVRGPSCIVRAFEGSETLIVMGNDCSLENLDIDGDDQGTGDNVQLAGARCILVNVSTRKAGQDNLRVGADMASLNANGWQLQHVRAYAAGRHNIFIHHTNASTSDTFPQGAPNANAGLMLGGDVSGAGSDGIKIGNAIDNRFVGVMVQESAGRNVHFVEGAQGNIFFIGYSEAGTSNDLFEANTKRNGYLFNRSVTGGAVPITDSGDGNMVIASSTNMLPDQYAFMRRLAIYAIGGLSPSLDLYSDGNQAAQIQGLMTGSGSQGKGQAWSKRNGNTTIPIFEWQDGVGINLLNGGLTVAGTKVIGARKTGWTAPTGTATRAAFDTATVTTAQLAERVKALIDDLHSTAGHGVIGA